MSEIPANKVISLELLGVPAAGEKQVGESKIARSPVSFDPAAPILRKPSWIRVRIPSGNSVPQQQAQFPSKPHGPVVLVAYMP
jgi:lipoic acid synthetase